MNKSKMLLCLFGAAVTATTFTGCAMCNMPIKNDASCVEPSHIASTSLKPENIAYVLPQTAACTDVFKPSFEAGAKRVFATGTGTSLEEATADAIANFMEKTECDYIVGTTRVITTKTHPTYRFFATTNYTVRLAGIPVTMSKLEKVQAPKAEKPNLLKALTPAPAAAPSLTKDDVKKIIADALAAMPKPEAEKKCCPLGMVKLTDINVKVDAKAIAEDPAGLVFPAKKK